MDMALKIADELKAMYEKAEDGEAVTMILLFGVRYADAIKANRFSVKEIVAQAGLRSSYVTEVNKGLKLAKYVGFT